MCPTVVSFDVTPCPATFGFDLDHVVSVHVAPILIIIVLMLVLLIGLNRCRCTPDSFNRESTYARPFVSLWRASRYGGTGYADENGFVIRNNRPRQFLPAIKFVRTDVYGHDQVAFNIKDGAQIRFDLSEHQTGFP